MHHKFPYRNTMFNANHAHDLCLIDLNTMDTSVSIWPNGRFFGSILYLHIYIYCTIYPSIRRWPFDCACDSHDSAIFSSIPVLVSIVIDRVDRRLFTSIIYSQYTNVHYKQIAVVNEVSPRRWVWLTRKGWSVRGPRSPNPVNIGRFNYHLIIIIKKENRE